MSAKSIELKSWLRRLIDGQPLERLIRVFALLGEGKEPAEVARELGEELRFVGGAARAAADFLYPHRAAGAAVERESDESARELAAADSCLDEEIDARQARQRFITALENAADAKDRARAPKEHRDAPPRTTGGQVLRYRAFQLRLVDDPELVQTLDPLPEPAPAPGKATNRPRRYNVEAEYALMDQWLQTQRNRYPGAWLPRSDDARGAAYKRSLTAIAEDEVLSEAQIACDEAREQWQNCLATERRP